MTNKSYFKNLCETKLFLGDFVVEFHPFHFSNFIPSSKFDCKNRFCFHVFNLSGEFLHLKGSVSLTPRCIHTEFSYSDPNLCKFSPYELREWCPAIHLPFSNYLHWRKFMRLALEIFVESNPKLLSE